MVKLNRIVSLLEEQRQELLDQLAAIDSAIGALHSAGTSAEAERPADPDVPAEAAASEVLPRRVKPRRVLSDSHRQAVIVGKRNARSAKEAAKGLARELPDDTFVPAIGKRGDRQPPRLVKRIK